MLDLVHHVSLSASVLSIDTRIGLLSLPDSVAGLGLHIGSVSLPVNISES